MRKIYALFFCIILLSTACERLEHGEKKPYQFYRSDFHSKINLVGHAYKLDQTNKAGDVCIIPESDLLLIIDIKGPYLVKVYQLSTFRFIKSFIEKGTGSGQLMMCMSLQYNRFNKLLYTSDPYTKTVYGYAINDICYKKTSEIFPVSIVSLDVKALPNAVVFKDKHIVSFNYNYKTANQGVLHFFDQQGKSLSVTGNYPPSSFVYKPIELSTVYSGWLDISQNHQKIVVSYVLTDFIDVFDTDGKLIKRIQGPDIFDPEVVSNPASGGTFTRPTANAHLGYSNKGRMSERELLILYSGQSAKSRAYQVHDLFDFDQDMKPKVLYHLDKTIFAFDIDWRTRTLYGLSHLNGSSIIKYQL